MSEQPSSKKKLTAEQQISQLGEWIAVAPGRCDNGECWCHGGISVETSAVHKAHDPTCGVFAGMACDCGWLDEHR